MFHALLNLRLIEQVHFIRLSKILKRFLYHCIGFEITCYPGGGSEYKTHIDGNDSVKRRLTCLYYANKEWQAGDGGELQLFLPNGKKKKVRPSCDTLVIFQSQWLPHCVLPTNFERYAVTFWMY